MYIDRCKRCIYFDDKTVKAFESFSNEELESMGINTKPYEPPKPDTAMQTLLSSDSGDDTALWFSIGAIFLAGILGG